METDWASPPAWAPRSVRPGPGSACPPGWSPRPARGRLTRVCAAPAAGSPRRVWGGSASGAGGWAGVGTPSGAGGAAVSAGGPSRLPGLYCREGGGAGENVDPGPQGPPSTLPPSLGTPTLRVLILSPPPGHARDPSPAARLRIPAPPSILLFLAPSHHPPKPPIYVRPKEPRPPARRPQPGDPLSQRAHPAPHPRFQLQGPRSGSPTAPPPPVTHTRSRRAASRAAQAPPSASAARARRCSSSSSRVASAAAASRRARASAGAAGAVRRETRLPALRCRRRSVSSAYCLRALLCLS